MVDLLDDVLNLGPRAKRTDPEAVTREERNKHDAIPDANESLTSWQAKPETVDAKLCHADDRDAKYTCAQCHRGACAAHFWVMFGLCRECATQERVSRFHADKQPEGTNWLQD